MKKETHSIIKKVASLQ